VIVSIAAGLAWCRRSIFDAGITSLVASVFVDDVADHVERAHYPAERPARRCGRACHDQGIKTALLTLRSI